MVNIRRDCSWLINRWSPKHSNGLINNTQHFNVIGNSQYTELSLVNDRGQKSLYRRKLLIRWSFYTKILGLDSLSSKTFYCQIASSLKAMRLDVMMIIALKFDRYLDSVVAEVSVKFQSDTKSINWISWLQDFTRFCSKTSYRLVNIGPDKDTP